MKSAITLTVGAILSPFAALGFVFEIAAVWFAVGQDTACEWIDKD